jgi:hypothetical protein
MAVANLFSRTTDAIKSAGSVATDSFQKAVDAGVSAKDTVVGIGSAAVDLGISAKDAVTDTADAVVGYATAVVNVGVTVAKILPFAGVAIAMVVAPVPTVVGITIIELLAAIGESHFTKVEEELAARKIARENGRAIGKLASYGDIPSTALVETEAASLKLDIATGTIEGTVKAEDSSRLDIAGMTENQLRKFADGADLETSGLIAAYLKFREATRAQA